MLSPSLSGSTSLAWAESLGLTSSPSPGRKLAGWVALRVRLFPTYPGGSAGQDRGYLWPLAEARSFRVVVLECALMTVSAAILCMSEELAIEVPAVGL